jgi:MOSC domain-containing protein YiiM
LAGDQFYIDFDLSNDNLPIGSLLTIGEAVIEVTAEPHLGCSEFSRRYDRETTKFVNSKIDKMLNLRSINAKVISSGKVDLGASIRKIGG